MPADEERAHREKLRKEYTRRKRLLEIRKARQGDAADASLDIDLEEVNASLTLLDAADAPQATKEVRAAVGQEHIDQLVIAQVAKIAERLTTSEAHIQDIAASLAQWVGSSQERWDMIGEKIAAVVDTMHEERYARRWGQRRNLWLSAIAIVVGLVAVVLLVAF